MTHIFSLISSSFIPVIATIIISYGVFKRAPVYDYFIEGAKSGLKTAFEILPFIIGIFLAVNCLTASNLTEFLNSVLSPILSFFEIPTELLPLMLLRSISGSGSYIVLQDIIDTVGPDSYAGRVACVMTGGCETIIYVLALYFGVTHAKEMRHAFKGGLITYITGIIISLVICRYI